MEQQVRIVVQAGAGSTGEEVAVAANETIRLTNKIHLYRLAFRNLDNVINLFFLSYGRLDRPSLNCARLWTGVMRLRTLMTNAITALSDQDRYLAFEFEEVRLKEMNTLLRPARVWVAKSLQYILMYLQKRTQVSTEMWRFQRKGFLRQHSKNLFERMDELASKWTSFLLKYYDVNSRPETAKAFETHLQIEDRKARLALAMDEPFSQIGINKERYFQVLSNMFNNLNEDEGLREDDFLLLRVQLHVAKDLIDVTLSKEILYDENDYNTHRRRSKWAQTVKDNQWVELIEQVQKFLDDQPALADILQDDERIWPHQMGIKDLGPFSLVHLDNPEQYIDLDYSSESYRLRDGIDKIKGLEPFLNTTTRMTGQSLFTYDDKTREALGINKRASYVRFLFPLKNLSHLKPVLTPLDSKRDEELLQCQYLADDESALHCLVLYGGFAYYDRSNKLLNVKGLTIGDDLFFDGPYFIPDPQAYRRLANAGVPSGPVSFLDLKNQGAINFGWVAGEAGNLMNVPEDDPNHGKFAKAGVNFRAFFYEYNNETDVSNSRQGGSEIELLDTGDWHGGARRNYFQVITFEEMFKKKEKNNNTPILGNLDYLVSKYHEDWNPDILYRKGVIQYMGVDFRNFAIIGVPVIAHVPVMQAHGSVVKASQLQRRRLAEMKSTRDEGTYFRIQPLPDSSRVPRTTRKNQPNRTSRRKGNNNKGNNNKRNNRNTKPQSVRSTYDINEENLNRVDNSDLPRTNDEILVSPEEVTNMTTSEPLQLDRIYNKQRRSSKKASTRAPDRQRRGTSRKKENGENTFGRQRARNRRDRSTVHDPDSYANVSNFREEEQATQ